MHFKQHNRRSVGIRRLAALAVGASLILGFTACSAESTPNADCDGDAVELSILRMATEPPTDDQLEAYTESTGGCITFKVQEVPFAQFDEKVSVLGSSANPPDVYGYDMPNTAAYASNGVLLPLDDYLPDGWKDDVVPATLKEVSYEDQVYSLGLKQEVLSLYYNKTLTDAAGIEVPTTLEDAWTWEEARDAMLQCQEGTPGNPDIYGLAPTQLGAGTPGPIYSDLLVLRSAGDPEAPEDSSAYKTYWALSPDGTEVDGWLNTPEAVEAAEFYQSLFNGSKAVTSKTGRPNAFLDGIACFDIFHSAQVEALEDADVSFEWGNSPLPYINTPIVHTGAITLGVSANSKNADAASEFVVALSTGDMAKAYNEEHLRMPTLNSIYEELPVFQEPPRDMFYQELAEWGQPRPPTTHFSQYSQIVETALKNIAYGSDPQEQLDLAVEQLTPIISK